MTSPAPSTITSVLKENRSFPPPAEFSAKAHIKSLAEQEKLVKQAHDDPEGFWAKQAERLTWFKKWDRVLEWNEPFAKWFVGGQLNVSYNCLDRHLETAIANKAALIWEGEPAGPGKPGEQRTLTFKQLHHEVCQFANMLK